MEVDDSTDASSEGLTPAPTESQNVDQRPLRRPWPPPGAMYAAWRPPPRVTRYYESPTPEPKPENIPEIVPPAPTTPSPRCAPKVDLSMWRRAVPVVPSQGTSLAAAHESSVPTKRAVSPMPVAPVAKAVRRSIPPVPQPHSNVEEHLKKAGSISLADTPGAMGVVTPPIPVISSSAPSLPAAREPSRPVKRPVPPVPIAPVANAIRRSIPPVPQPASTSQSLGRHEIPPVPAPKGDEDLDRKPIRPLPRPRALHPVCPPPAQLDKGKQVARAPPPNTPKGKVRTPTPQLHGQGGDEEGSVIDLTTPSASPASHRGRLNAPARLEEEVVNLITPSPSPSTRSPEPAGPSHHNPRGERGAADRWVREVSALARQEFENSIGGFEEDYDLSENTWSKLVALQRRHDEIYHYVNYALQKYQP